MPPPYDDYVAIGIIRKSIKDYSANNKEIFLNNNLCHKFSKER